MAQCDCSASNEHPLLIGTRAGAKVSCSDPRPAAGEKNPVINVELSLSPVINVAAFCSRGDPLVVMWSSSRSWVAVSSSPAPPHGVRGPLLLPEREAPRQRGTDGAAA